MNENGDTARQRGVEKDEKEDGAGVRSLIDNPNDAAP